MIDQTVSVLLYDIKEKKLTTLVEQKNLMISSAVFADGKIVITATDGKPYGEGQYHDIYEYDETLKKPVKKVQVDCLLGVDIMTDCQYSHGERMVQSMQLHSMDIRMALFLIRERQMVHMKKMKHLHGMVLSVR